MSSIEPVIVTISGGVAEINDTEHDNEILLIDYDECNENIDYALEQVSRILNVDLDSQKKSYYIKEILVKHG